MKQLMNVNFAVESFVFGDSSNYVVRAMLDPRQAPIVLGVFTDVNDVANCISEFNKELLAKSEQQKS